MYIIHRQCSMSMSSKVSTLEGRGYTHTLSRLLRIITHTHCSSLHQFFGLLVQWCALLHHCKALDVQRLPCCDHSDHPWLLHTRGMLLLAHDLATLVLDVVALFQARCCLVHQALEDTMLLCADADRFLLHRFHSLHRSHGLHCLHCLHCLMGLVTMQVTSNPARTKIMNLFISGWP